MISRFIRVLSCGILMGLPSCTGWQSALDPRSTQAGDLYRLIVQISIACAIIWSLVVVAMIAGLWHRRGEPATGGPIQPGKERMLNFVVGAAVAATVVVVIAFTLASFYVTRSLGSEQADLIIKVRGQQWWWDVRYLDAQSKQDFSTANEIHIPVGRTVRIDLESIDVIHSFWVPNLAGKQDLVPGRSNTLTIRAKYPGVFRGQCAEFCGLQHAHMAFLVIAEDDDQFAKWASTQRANALSPTDAESDAGLKTFLAKPCAACHTIRGTTANGTTGPDLTHIGGRMYIAAGLLETTRGSLAAWIVDPQTLKPGNNMPMVALSAEELRALSSYMASLK